MNDKIVGIILFLIIMYFLFSMVIKLTPLIVGGALVYKLISHENAKYHEKRAFNRLLEQNKDGILEIVTAVELQVENKTEGILNVWLSVTPPTMETSVMFDKFSGYGRQNIRYRYQIMGNISAVAGTLFDNQMYDPSQIKALSLKLNDGRIINLNNSVYRCAVFSLDGVDYLEIMRE